MIGKSLGSGKMIQSIKKNIWYNCSVQSVTGNTDRVPDFKAFLILDGQEGTEHV